MNPKGKLLTTELPVPLSVWTISNSYKICNDFLENVKIKYTQWSSKTWLLFSSHIYVCMYMCILKNKYVCMYEANARI